MSNSSEASRDLLRSLLSEYSEQQALEGASKIMEWSAYTGDFFHIEHKHDTDGRTIGIVLGAALPPEYMNDETERAKLDKLVNLLNEAVTKADLIPYPNQNGEQQGEAPQPETQPVE